jgi:hypothetical protein
LIGGLVRFGPAGLIDRERLPPSFSQRSSAFLIKAYAASSVLTSRFEIPAEGLARGRVIDFMSQE